MEKQHRKHSEQLIVRLTPEQLEVVDAKFKEMKAEYDTKGIIFTMQDYIRKCLMQG